MKKMTYHDGSYVLHGIVGNSWTGKISAWYEADGTLRDAERIQGTKVFPVKEGGPIWTRLENIGAVYADEGERPRMKNPRHGNDDPSRDEMIEHIRKVYGREADEFDIEEAIYWFANDYHGGQSSNLYSALSTSEFRPGRMSNGPEEGSMGEMIYADLVDTFSPKKNPVKRRKGESVRDFTSRCMSEEKKSFPKVKQRIAVCLSKARKNPFNDRNLDA